MPTWIRTDNQKPQTNRPVEWISPGGVQQRGTYAGGTVWFPEGSPVYVYYTPEFWRYVDA